MRLIKLIVVLVPCALFLSACSMSDEQVAQQQQTVAHHCLEGVARASGLRDAQDGKPVDPGYAKICPTHLVNTITEDYMDGYKHGVDVRGKMAQHAVTAQQTAAAKTGDFRKRVMAK